MKNNEATEAVGELLNTISEIDDYGEAAPLLHLLNNVASELDDNSAAFGSIVEFAVSRAEKLIRELPDVTDEHRRDDIFGYVSLLLKNYDHAVEHGADLHQGDAEIMNTLRGMADAEHLIERTVFDTFEPDPPAESGISEIVALRKTFTTDFQAGRLIVGLLHYSEKFDVLSAQSRAELATLANGELARLLSLSELTGDAIDALEVCVDLCGHLPTNDTLPMLDKAIKLGRSNIGYYAASSVLKLVGALAPESIVALMRDIEYADLTYSLVRKHKLAEIDARIPPELKTPEYLAESDLVHWLTYPTELGRKPDEIELIGKVKSHGEPYYVFKYKSASDTLADEDKNVWLIGWANDNGGTFSEFEHLSDYEGATPEKTLKTIKKKCL